MRKSVLTILLGVCSFSSLAKAEGQLIQQTEVLNCTVEEIDGNISSFLPPQVGDSIVFDLSRDTHQSLTFKSAANSWTSFIGSPPLQKTLLPVSFQVQQVFFQALAESGFGENTQVAITAVDVDDSGGPLRWTARIQKLYNEQFGHWILTTLFLSCEELPPA